MKDQCPAFHEWSFVILGATGKYELKVVEVMRSAALINRFTIECCQQYNSKMQVCVRQFCKSMFESPVSDDRQVAYSERAYHSCNWKSFS